MQSRVISVGGITAPPGAKSSGTLKVGELTHGALVEIPVTVINGSKPGKIMHVGGGTHGCETVGIEAARRLAKETRPDDLAGTLICSPLENPPTFLTHSHEYPFETPYRDLMMMYPGNPQGSLTERIAYTLFREAISKADYVIELHSPFPGLEFIPNAMYYSVDSRRNRKFAEATGAPIIYERESPDEYYKGEWTACRPEVIVLSIENGESETTDPERVAEDMKIVTNAMKYVGMMEGKPEPLAKEQHVVVKSVHVRSNKSGLLFSKVRPGDLVKKDQIVAEVIDMFSNVEEVRTPVEGIVQGSGTSVSVGTGDPVARIGLLETS